MAETTTQEAAGIVRSFLAAAKQDLADTPTGCDSRPSLQQDVNDLKKLFSILSTHVLVPNNMAAEMERDFRNLGNGIMIALGRQDCRRHAEALAQILRGTGGQTKGLIYLTHTNTCFILGSEGGESSHDKGQEAATATTAQRIPVLFPFP